MEKLYHIFLIKSTNNFLLSSLKSNKNFQFLCAISQKIKIYKNNCTKSSELLFILLEGEKNEELQG